MADTSVQHDAEAWVVEHGLPTIFPGMTFRGVKLPLKWGGQFNFDAVSLDGSVVGSISTSARTTASGNLATAKFQKLKTDALYLLNLQNPARMVMVFTEQSMHEHFCKEKNVGRFPPDIDLHHVSLPYELHQRVLEARARASKETSPIRIPI
ncbi:MULTISPECIES: hypothetical protein [Burkholderia cepacia complex]|uniref:hypothetical protein n=1 Tax=Burkholderia cepacia complex TaxID=87882 RepID=UPI001581BFBB|nr:MULTISPECIES: hypothetical protein [Burkholderia cepacia complex]MCA8088986.1 hypothetical protein [Burkholderia cenocepacia]